VKTLRTQQHCVAQWSLTSGKKYRDPFRQVALDAVVTAPDGTERAVPAYWAGGQYWGLRYAPTIPGLHRYRTVCSDTANKDLHGRDGAIQARAYQGKNPLQRHGCLRVAADRRHLEHADGTPFFWLGDTWWMGFTKRLPWPAGFEKLARDRVAKGFTLIQIVAGLYPDMEWQDPRGANEAGFPWKRDFSRLNPGYFDKADRRVAHLVESGLVPCIVGSWGYFLEFAGLDVLKRHWRNLVARYAAYPVVWCVAGEALMDWYLRPRDNRDPEQRRRELRAQWSELARYIRSIDPAGHPITIHPTRIGHDQVDDPAVLDLDMLQSGHGGYPSLSDTVQFVSDALDHQPQLPVLVGEVNYEGIGESSREEMQRFLFWTCLLSGAAGHTYGANGIWQLNGRAKPYGLSPHGSSWGGLPWEDAARLPGSTQLGLGKKLLERYPWSRFETHLEWIEPAQTAENRFGCYAAGIPRTVRIIYIPTAASWTAWGGAMTVNGLEQKVAYRAFWFDPKSGKRSGLGKVHPNAEAKWVVPKPPVFQDWVLVLEAAKR